MTLRYQSFTKTEKGKLNKKLLFIPTLVLNLELTNQSINKSILPEKQSSSSDPSLQSCTLSQRSASCKQTPSLNFYELIIYLYLKFYWQYSMSILLKLEGDSRNHPLPPCCEHTWLRISYFLIISLTLCFFYHLHAS